MGLQTWKTLFGPEFTHGGIDSLTRGVVARLFDDFEDYADNAALQAVWIETGGVGNPTLTTAANAIHGLQSMQVAAAGSDGTIYRALDNNFFGYPAPGRIRYIAFNAAVSAGATTDNITVRLSDASDINLYKEWTFTIAQNKTLDYIIDLYSGSTTALTGGGFLNEESRPGPTAEGATAWNHALIDRLTFGDLTDGLTYRFDNIRFFYNTSLLDAIGFGTEPPTDDGTDGSIHSKLRTLSNHVLELVGSTEVFAKFGPPVAYLNYNYTFGLELLGYANQGIPSTTEIVPGNYRIDRVRDGTTTEIVASSAASESAGFIYATYQPVEDNWQPGDELIVEFSGGSIYNDTDDPVLLTATSSAGQAVVTVDNAALFQVGQMVRIYDDTPDTEWGTVLSIDSPTQLTLSGNLANEYTVAQNAAIVLAEQTVLPLARYAASVTYEPELDRELKRWVLADYDDFDTADADANTERWDVGYIANTDGTAAGAEGGSSDINTTTAGQLRVAVDPDVTPTQSAYAVKRDEPSYSRYFALSVDADVTIDNTQATSSYVGLRVSSGDVDDASNYVLIAREISSGQDRIATLAEFGGVAQTPVYAAITDTSVGFKIERYGNVWNVFYSLTQYPNWQWVKVTQFEDASGNMSSTTSCYLYAESGGTVDAQTSLGDFDNWRYYIGSGALDQILSTLVVGSGTFTTSSATVPADTGRTEENDYWNGHILMPITGVVAFQARAIVDFVNAGGVFTIDGDQPYTTAPAIGDEYVILVDQIQLEPGTDSTNNQTAAHVVGSKADTADYTYDAATSSLQRLTKGILGSRVIEEGTFTTSSATVPADTTLGAAYGNDYFNSQILIPLTGDVAFQPRLITDFATTTGVFTIDGDHPFTAATGTVAYIIISNEADLIPGTDSANDQTTAQAVGAKADTADYTYNATTSSLQRLVKGILGVEVIAEGTLTTSSTTVPADTGRAEANDYWNGSWLVPLTGSVAFQPRLIVDFANAGGVFTIDGDQPFTAATGTVVYVILSRNSQLVPAADSTNNQTPAQVLGNKSDAASVAASTASVIARLRGVEAALSVNAVAGGEFEIDGVPDLWDALVVDSSSQADIISLTGDRDGAIIERLSAIINALNITNSGSGTGLEEDGASNLVTALGTDGVTVTDSAVSVLGAIGADNADNAFASTLVTQNGDGSVLERLEEIRGTTSTATHNIEIAHGTAEQTVADLSPIRHGTIAVEVDLATLVTAGEGGTIIVRLKNMIDGANLREIDSANFLIGTDSTHPTVAGFVQEGTSTARITIQINSVVGAQRAVPYRIIESA